MRCLVTLAPEDQEPYATGVRGLAEAARLAGCASLVLGDAALGGDRPWQAKRIAVRMAFESGVDCVFWSDSDVIVRRPNVLAQILGMRAEPGIWVRSWLSLDGYWGMHEIRNAAAGRDPVYTAAAKRLYREVCALHGLPGEGKHFHDYFVGYCLPRDAAMRVCDLWDGIAERLLAEGLTWSDGLSLGIAAEAAGVVIRRCVSSSRLRGAMVHLLHSNRTRRYQELGQCLP